MDKRYVPEPNHQRFMPSIKFRKRQVCLASIKKHFSPLTTVVYIVCEHAEACETM